MADRDVGHVADLPPPHQRLGQGWTCVATVEAVELSGQVEWPDLPEIAEPARAPGDLRHGLEMDRGFLAVVARTAEGGIGLGPFGDERRVPQLVVLEAPGRPPMPETGRRISARDPVAAAAWASRSRTIDLGAPKMAGRASADPSGQVVGGTTLHQVEQVVTGMAGARIVPPPGGGLSGRTPLARPSSGHAP